MITSTISIPPTPKRYPQGNDVAVQVDFNLTLTYWDLWCIVCADETFSGSLNNLKDHLIYKRLNDRFWSSFVQHHLEDIITHLEELEPKIDRISPFNQFLEKLPVPFYRKERQKAARNVIEGYANCAPSESMLRSPRRLSQQEAMRGQWKRLPIDPTPIAERIRPLSSLKKMVSFRNLHLLLYTGDWSARLKRISEISR